ncbi:MAG: hypothetical protein NE334_21645 [Lentisphaeraceae bacterium]|nr:hypothetical protein [Lentisphaeraceae bacterium]
MEQLKILTIVTESVLENQIAEDIEKHGAHGYTITDARGKGHRGLRDAGWDYNSNIRVEIVCNLKTCNAISKFLLDTYYNDYAMITFSYDVTVQRSNKF